MTGDNDFLRAMNSLRHSILTNRQRAHEAIDAAEKADNATAKKHAQWALDAANIAFSEYERARAEGRWNETSRRLATAAKGDNDGCDENLFKFSEAMNAK